MKQRKRILITLAALALILAAAAAAYAVSSYGTQADPLVTKSYLDEVLTPELMAEFNAQLDAHENAPGGGAFTVVTLSRGQTVTCQTGCEVMLRIGSARASGDDSPALVDTTSGTTLDGGGALEKNHLYMVTIAGNGLTASEETTKILISGEYTIN